MSNWFDCRLGDQITLQRGFDITQKHMNEGNVPVISSGGIMGHHDVAKVNGPGVVIGRKGTLGTVHYIQNNYWPHDTTLWVKDFKGNLPKFVYYFLQTLNLQRFDVGSANPTLNRNHVHPIPVKWPELALQEEIVNILSPLDEKVKINQSINETLEKIAITLYKYWFIDFGPFQDEQFVESELGLIPKGWKITSLDSFFPIKTGKKNANFATENGAYPFFTCSKSISRADSYSFDGKAILLAGNGDFNVKLYSGKFEAYQRTYVLIPYNPELVALLYLAIKYHLNDLASGATGSVIKFLTKGMIGNYKITVNPLVLEKFSMKINPLFKGIEQNQKEIESLIQLRNSILPYLFSGKVEFKKVQKLVEEVL